MKALQLTIMLLLVVIIGLLTFGLHILTREDQWEYAIVSPSDRQFKIEMDKAGALGWEVVSGSPRIRWKLWRGDDHVIRSDSQEAGRRERLINRRLIRQCSGFAQRVATLQVIHCTIDATAGESINVLRDRKGVLEFK